MKSEYGKYVVLRSMDSMLIANEPKLGYIFLFLWWRKIVEKLYVKSIQMNVSSLMEGNVRYTSACTNVSYIHRITAEVFHLVVATFEIVRERQ